jgi:hypothetical protein
MYYEKSMIQQISIEETEGLYDDQSTKTEIYLLCKHRLTWSAIFDHEYVGGFLV